MSGKTTELCEYLTQECKLRIYGRGLCERGELVKRTAERTLDFPLDNYFSMENCLSFSQGRTLVSTGVYPCPPFPCIYSQSCGWRASFFTAVVVYYSYSRAFVNFLASLREFFSWGMPVPKNCVVFSIQKQPFECRVISGKSLSYSRWNT